MKNKGLIIVLIVVLAILAIGLLGFMIMAMNGSLKGVTFGYNVSNELVVDEVYDESFDEVWIDSDASNIILTESLDDKVHVLIYGDEERTTVEHNEKTLEIKTKAKKCFGICFNTQIAKVEVSLPENYDGSFELKNRFGDIEVGNFKDSSMNIENNYGNINIRKAKSLNIKEDCGDVKIGTVEEAIVKNNFGDIKIEEVTSYVDLKNSCGDIKIEKAMIDRNSFIKDNMGNIKIGSLNEVYVDARTSLGDLKIDNNYRHSDITLKIDNDCGDIKVTN